MPEEFSNKTST